MVERLDRLRHDAVVGRDHEDREVGHLRTTCTHGGERLVTRGVDEGDRALDALVLGPDLVRTDVLGDAARLAGDDVGVADRVEQSGLTVIDVTHDGDHRRTDLEVVLVLFLELLIEVETEALEELLVFVLGRNHLDLVAELLAQYLERGLVERLGRGRHLTQVEQDGDERAGLHRVAGDVLDLVGEVRDRCAAAHPDRLPVAALDVDATDDRGIPHLEFLALSPARLTLLGLAATLTERTRRTAAGATAATATTAGTTGEAAAGRAHREHRDGIRRHRHRRDDRDRRDAAGTAHRRDDRGPPGRPGPPGRGAPRRGAPGRGACGRGMLPGVGDGRWPMPCALAKGLLPGRGPAGR